VVELVSVRPAQAQLLQLLAEDRAVGVALGQAPYLAQLQDRPTLLLGELAIDWTSPAIGLPAIEVGLSAS
jgi:hypothetical protein